MERRLTGMIAAAAVLILLFVFWDLFRPAPRVDDSADPVVAVADTPAVTPQPPPPPTSSSQGTIVPAGPITSIGNGAGGREPTYIDMLARSETRRRIRASAGSTYLADMLAAEHQAEQLAQLAEEMQPA